VSYYPTVFASAFYNSEYYKSLQTKIVTKLTRDTLKAGCIAFQCRFVINKCFLLNPEKKLAQIHLVVFEKNAKKRNFNSEK